MVIEFVHEAEWNSLPQPRRLTADQIGRFYEDGYLVVENLFEPTELAEISEALHRLTSTAQRFTQTTLHRGTQFVVEQVQADADANAAAQSEVRIHRVVWAGSAEPILSAYGRDPRLVGLAGQLLGSRRMEQLINQVHFKYPGDGVAFDWHQDSRHRRYGTHLWTDVDGRGSFVQAITAIDEVTADNGPIKLIPGSHHDGHIACDPVTRKLPANRFSEADAIVLTMKPGTVVLVGPYTIHGSDANESDAPRRLFINGFSLPGANRRIYPGRDAGRSVWTPPSVLGPRPLND